jgi:hypothetical protein
MPLTTRHLMVTRNLPGVRGWSELKIDILTAVCEPIDFLHSRTLSRLVSWLVSQSVSQPVSVGVRRHIGIYCIHEFHSTTPEHCSEGTASARPRPVKE